MLILSADIGHVVQEGSIKLVLAPGGGLMIDGGAHTDYHINIWAFYRTLVHTGGIGHFNLKQTDAEIFMVTASWAYNSQSRTR